MRTRAEHVKWCKMRAWDAFNYDKERGKQGRGYAVASMISDLGKHEDTRDMVLVAIGLASTVVDEKSLRAYIDGFAE